MNIGPWLDLTTVQVGRMTEAGNGLGAVSQTTVLTTLSRAALWQAGSNDGLLSGKVAQQSSHVLVVETNARTWTSTDTVIVYAGDTYGVVGRPDNVANQSELTVVSLDLIT